MKNDYEIERTAIRLVQKYGKKALVKVVETTKYYLSEGDPDNAKRWISIGYAIKKMQNIENIKEIVLTAEEGISATELA